MTIIYQQFQSLLHISGIRCHKAVKFGCSKQNLLKINHLDFERFCLDNKKSSFAPLKNRDEYNKQSLV